MVVRLHNQWLFWISLQQDWDGVEMSSGKSCGHGGIMRGSMGPWKVRFVSLVLQTGVPVIFSKHDQKISKNARKKEKNGPP
jgi:hypothetical protein